MRYLSYISSHLILSYLIHFIPLLSHPFPSISVPFPSLHFLSSYHLKFISSHLPSPSNADPILVVDLIWRGGYLNEANEANERKKAY